MKAKLLYLKGYRQVIYRGPWIKAVLGHILSDNGK